MIGAIIDTGRTFEIYSIGDGLMLRRVIDSVAAMSNSGMLLDLVALSMMLGLLIMGFRNVIAGGHKLDLGSTLVAVILGTIMFGMKADVVIHDMNFAPGEVDQPSYTVANVPFGIAAAGYIISNIGYELTLKMEQGFGLYAVGRSSLIEGGFGNSLEWINEIRAWEKPSFGDGPTGKASLFRENMTNYMAECVAPAIKMGHMQVETILHSQDLWTQGSPTGGGIGYTSQWLNTAYRGTNGISTSISCIDAFNNLNADRADVFPAFASALAKSKLDLSTSGQDVETAMTAAYNSIGVNSQRMQNLVVAELAGLSLEAALSGTDSAVISAQSKMMIDQASMQRAVQWAGEETMFRRIMRPMMAFFEALMYGLAPFMALAIGLGSFGIQTVGKYLMLSIWVALWMPVLSLIELYQITMMQHAVTAMISGLDGTGGAGVTIATANALRQQSIDWLASGAALAAWTPAITMALVWGGAVTASALAGQLRGGDHINEKQVAPDATNAPAAMSVGSSHDYSRAAGMVAGGGGSNVPRIYVGQDASTLQASAARYVESAKAEYSAALSAERSETNSLSRRAGASTDVGNSGMTSAMDTGSATKTVGAGKNKTSQFDNSVQHDDSSQTSSELGMEAGAKFPGGKGGSSGAGMGVGAGGKSVSVNRSSDGKRHSSSTGKSETESAEIRDGNEFRSGQTHTETSGFRAGSDAASTKQASKSERLQRAEAQLAQAEANYQQQSALAGKYGVQQSVDVGSLAKRAIETGQAANFDGLVQAAGVGTKAKSEMGAMLALGMDREQAKVAGQILALRAGAMDSAGGTGSADSATKASAYASAMEGNLISGEVYAGGVSMRPDTNAGMVQSVGDRVPSRDDMQQRVGGVTGPSFSAEEVSGRVGAALAGNAGTLASMMGEAHQSVGANPGGFGSHSASAGQDAAGSAAAVGAPMVAAVEKSASQSMAVAGNGFAAQFTNPAADVTTLHGQQLLENASTLQSQFGRIEGRAGPDHSLTKMAEALDQQNPWIRSEAKDGAGASNMLATLQMLNSARPMDVPSENLEQAIAYSKTDEGAAMLAAYGSRHSGAARMVESQARVEGGHPGMDGLPMHRVLQEGPLLPEGTPVDQLSAKERRYAGLNEHDPREAGSSGRETYEEWSKKNPDGLGPAPDDKRH